MVTYDILGLAEEHYLCGILPYRIMQISGLGKLA